MVLSGNTLVSNFSISPSFGIWKSIGRGYSSWSSQVYGFASHSRSFLHHPLGLRPVPRLQLHPFPSLHLLSWHLTALISAVDRRSLYKTPTRLPPSFWPSLMPLGHPLRRRLITVTSIYLSILPSGTALSPGIAPVCRSILSLPSSG